MRFRIVIEYSSEESAECFGGAHDTISDMLNVLPFMVDNVSVVFEEVDEEAV